MTPFSVEATLMLARMLVKSCGPRTRAGGRSTNFRSPNVANSKVQFCNVSSEKYGKDDMSMALQIQLPNSVESTQIKSLSLLIKGKDDAEKCPYWFGWQ